MKKIITKIPFVKKIAALIRSKICRDKYAEYVSSAKHNKIELIYQGIPIPPIRFRDMVRKGAVLAEDFLLEGRQVYEEIHRFLAANQVKISKSAKILEFGVGCGRVSRYFHQDGYSQFNGSDVDAELIDWCRSNLASNKSSEEKSIYITNGYLPPLQCDNGSYDLVYSISVFTHMVSDSQALWLNELARIVRPGGFLLISFLELSESELPNGVRVDERIDKEFKRSWLGENGAPKVYFTTYNTLNYFKNYLSKSFKFVGYKNRAIRNKQSLVCFEKLNDLI